MHTIFGTKHLIILGICLVAILGGYFSARKWSLDKLTKVLFSIGIVSELIKVFYYIITFIIEVHSITFTISNS